MWTPTTTKKLGVDWYRGFILENKMCKGIFPCSYVHLKDYALTNAGPYETVIPMEDSVAQEVANVLKDWLSIWKKLYEVNNMGAVRLLAKCMSDMIALRRQLLHGTLPGRKENQIKAQLLSKIDWGNRLLGLDLVPRKGFQVVDPETFDLLELFKLHAESEEHSRKVGISRLESDSLPSRKHVFLFINKFTSEQPDVFEIVLSTFDAFDMRQLHESYAVRYDLSNTANSGVQKAIRAAIFQNLESSDPKKQLYKDLYLVVKIYRLGNIIANEGTKKVQSTSSFRRPFGCAVLGLSNIMTGLSMNLDEQIVRVYSCADTDFHSLPESILKKQMSKISLVNNTSISLSVQALTSDTGENNNITVKGVDHIARTDDINLDELKNDILLTVMNGEFEKAGKAVAKNIEVQVELVNEDGTCLPDSFAVGMGIKPTADYATSVVYHCNNPKWNEVVKVSLPNDYSIEQLGKLHLRFLVRHCSTKDKQDRKPLCFAYLVLIDSDGAAIADEVHTLSLYKWDDESKLPKPSQYLYASGHKSLMETLHNSPSSHGRFFRHDQVVNGKLSANPSRSTSASVNSAAKISSSTTSDLKCLKDVLRVSTKLRSWRLTQNKDVLMLLKWRSHPDYTGDAISKLRSVPLAELIKFLNHILDALFTLFQSPDGSSTVHTKTVFKALMYIFGVAEKSGNESLKQLVVAYEKTHFSSALAYCGILTCLVNYTDKLRMEFGRHRVDPFAGLETLISYAVCSRRLQLCSTELTADNTVFWKLVRKTFTAFDVLVQQDLPILSTAKDALLLKLPRCLTLLSSSLTNEHMVLLLEQMLQSLQLASHNSLSSKMRIQTELMKSPLIKTSAFRNVMFPSVFQQLKMYLHEQTDLQCCLETLQPLLAFLHTDAKCDSFADVESSKPFGLATILEPLVSCILPMERSHRTYAELIATLFSILRLMSCEDYDSLVTSLSHCDFQPGKKRLKDFLFRIFLLFRDVVRTGETVAFCDRKRLSDSGCQMSASITSKTSGFQPELVDVDSSKEESNISSVTQMPLGTMTKNQEIFNSNWTVFKMAVNKVILESMQEFSEVLCNNFLTTTDFDYQLWSAFFNLCVCFMTQPSLRLESFAESKRNKILERYGDMRVLTGFLFQELWCNLGSRKAHFVPFIIGPVLEMGLVPQNELRKTIIPVFYDLIEIEAAKQPPTNQVELECIDKLDVLVSEGQGDEEFQHLFHTILNDFAREKQPIFQPKLEAFIEAVCNLLGKLLDYRVVTSGQENTYKRMACIVNLLNYYRYEISREEMAQRYIYKLSKILIDTGYFIEAGACLKLHADMMSWGRHNLHADLNYPAQVEWERKETILLKILSFYERGQCYEHGIPICKQLALFYEHEIFDYTKLAKILRFHADLLDKILTEVQRFVPEYFKVGYFGQLFPAFVRNKTFVYRAHQFEKIGGFTQRLWAEWPSAEILSSTVIVDDTVKLSSKQYIQICSVKPIPKHRKEFESCNVPTAVKHYFSANDIDTFQHTWPLDKRGSMDDRQFEFKTLWSEKTTVKTEFPLPNILCWSPVVRQESVIISPVQNACVNVVEKNHELRELIHKYSMDTSRFRKDHKNCQPILMVLKGIIEAAVNGGIAMYQNAFFVQEFIETYPDQKIHVETLKSLVLEQLQLLDKGLGITTGLVDKESRPLHDYLLKRFQNMRHSIRMSASSKGCRISGRFSPTPSSPDSSMSESRTTRSAMKDIQPSALSSPLPPSIPPLQLGNSDCFSDRLCQSDRSVTTEPIYASIMRTSTPENGLDPVPNGTKLRGRKSVKYSSYWTPPFSKNRPRSVHVESEISIKMRKINRSDPNIDRIGTSCPGSASSSLSRSNRGSVSPRDFAKFFKQKLSRSSISSNEASSEKSPDSPQMPQKFSKWTFKGPKRQARSDQNAKLSQPRKLSNSTSLTASGIAKPTAKKTSLINATAAHSSYSAQSSIDNDKKPNRSISLNIPELSITPCNNNNGAAHMDDTENHYDTLANYVNSRQTDL